MLNPFLVVLNAEIKFRQYLRLPQAQALLPADVMDLIRKTIELVDLIYWEPSVRLNTAAALFGDPMLVDQYSVQDEDLEEQGEDTIQESNYGYSRDPPGVNATLAERRVLNLWSW
jgi:hypothetical protein